MTTPLAIVFLLGASAAVLGEKLSCDEVQNMMLSSTCTLPEEEYPIGYTNFNTGMYFDRVPVGSPHSRLGQTVVQVRPEENPPIINVYGKSYKLLMLKIESLDQSTPEKAAYMKLTFSENRYETFVTAVHIYVPLILSENMEDPHRNLWITRDFLMMGGLPQSGMYRVNSIEWLVPLLKETIRLSTFFGSVRAFMTDCQTVPALAVKDFFKDTASDATP